MNKKGLTVVELVVSFTLVIIICIFLIQIIINLTKVYNNNGKKTELLNKQSLISNEINSYFRDKGLISISKCDDADNCYFFNYSNGDRDKMKINNDKIFKFEKFAVELNDATFGEIKLDVIYTPTLQQYVNNSILILTIPINSDIDYNFDVKVVYQFNSDSSLIDEYFTP